MATFSEETLSKFADACAGIPLRPLDRAFERAGIRPGISDDDSGGARRAKFRRYVAGVDQRNAKQLQQLGDALGALIDETADSKKEFLIGAAERDGFAYAGGTFRPASKTRTSFAIERNAGAAGVEELGRRLHALAASRPADAVAGAKELLESLASLKRGTIAPAVRKSLQQLAEIVDMFDELRRQRGLGSGETAVRNARIATGAAVTFATYMAGTKN